jgi:hypothetical protein
MLLGFLSPLVGPSLFGRSGRRARCGLFTTVGPLEKVASDAPLPYLPNGSERAATSSR